METQSLEEFYKEKIHRVPAGLNSGVGHFNVFRLEDCKDSSPVRYSRRDYYKITLLRGHNRYHYADKSLEVRGTALIFFNPQVPYTWESIDEDATGYFCIFTPSFFTDRSRIALPDLPMFAIGGKPTYVLTPEQEAAIVPLFEKMLTEIDSDYTFKHDLLHNYTNEVIHLALKSEADVSLYSHPNANARITAVFNELLERQFPIETPLQRFSLRSAADFATNLSVHVNHLNRAVKTTTGKTTTTLISERLLAEAKALLKHTDWNIAEISNSLGFEEAAHFTNFFRKFTNTTPTGYRLV